MIRRRIYFLLPVLLIMFIPVGYAQEHFFCGNDWNKFLPVMKVSYISGLYDGTAFCEAGFLSSQNVDVSPMLRRFPMDMTYKDVVSALDVFYSDKKNSSVPIIYGVYIVKMNHEGLDNKKINAYKKEILSRIKDE